jgi:hypothetical protein
MANEAGGIETGGRPAGVRRPRARVVAVGAHERDPVGDREVGLAERTAEHRGGPRRVGTGAVGRGREPALVRVGGACEDLVQRDLRLAHRAVRTDHLCGLMTGS